MSDEGNYAIYKKTTSNLGQRALISAAAGGHVTIFNKLLNSGELGALRADCCNGLAIVEAAKHGWEDMVLLLLGLEADLFPPRADSQQGAALIEAAARGHII